MKRFMLSFAVIAVVLLQTAACKKHRCETDKNQKGSYIDAGCDKSIVNVDIINSTTTPVSIGYCTQQLIGAFKEVQARSRATNMPYTLDTVWFDNLNTSSINELVVWMFTDSARTYNNLVSRSGVYAVSSGQINGSNFVAFDNPLNLRLSRNNLVVDVLKATPFCADDTYRGYYKGSYRLYEDLEDPTIAGGGPLDSVVSGTGVYSFEGYVSIDGKVRMLLNSEEEYKMLSGTYAGTLQAKLLKQDQSLQANIAVAKMQYNSANGLEIYLKAADSNSPWKWMKLIED